MKFYALLTITNQSVIVWRLKTNFLLPSLYERRNSPSLAKRGYLPARNRFGEGRGEIFGRICLFNYELLSNAFVLG
jgi:hypothetical protein